MKKIIIFIILTIIIILFFAYFNIDSTSNYTIPRQLRYSFSIKNTTGKPIKNFKVFAYAPVKKTSTQYSIETKTSSPHQMTTDVLGNQILSFDIDLLAPYATKHITVKSTLNLSEMKLRINVPNKKQFTLPDHLVESDNPSIKMEAKGLKGEQLQETVSNIELWVNGHIKNIIYYSEPQGALFAFNHKKGDCTEFMNLSLALLRANNIPARGVAGYICKKSMVVKPNTYHNWVEYYDGTYWRVLDPMNNKVNHVESDYIAMKIINAEEKDPELQFERFYYKRKSGVTVTMN